VQSCGHPCFPGPGGEGHPGGRTRKADSRCPLLGPIRGFSAAGEWPSGPKGATGRGRGGSGTPGTWTVATTGGSRGVQYRLDGSDAGPETGAVDGQHALTVTAEADDRQNPVRGGASGLGTDHHSAPPRRRQAIGGGLNGGTPLAPVPVPS
jgi:hypothetical protein